MVPAQRKPLEEELQPFEAPVIAEILSEICHDRVSMRC